MAELVFLRRRNRCFEDNLMDDILILMNEYSDTDLNCTLASGDTPETIYQAFSMVASAYGKYGSGIQSHMLQVVLEKDEIKDMYQVFGIFEQIQYYIGSEFQVVVGISEYDDAYVGTYLFNSISYKTGRKFVDNNAALNNMKNWMETELGLEVEFSHGSLWGQGEACFTQQ